ncbi:MAG: GDSL-type esterase/lipase family protein [Clostridia bacterium]|nr:GDSL-type esterase/lipase family protein [Clostridia bacterium]
METNNKKWVAGWGTAITVMAQNHADYIKDQTFRYVIFPTVDGEGLRLHFSNKFGREDAVITKVFVAKRAEGEYIKPETNVQVTFGGEAACRLPAGGSAVSDEIPFSFTAGEEFAVSMYFGELTELYTAHSNNGYYIKKYYGKGDWAEKECVPLEDYGENGPYVFLNTIDFLTDSDVHAIIAFGDSITAQPWPDCLAHRIYDLGIKNVTVVRKAIGGGRMLREYKYRLKKHWGEAGIKRFEQDITQAGADRVFVLHGINDLIHPGVNNRMCRMDELPDAEEMIKDGYMKYIEIAHRHGMKIYMSPILPCPRCKNDDGVREKTRLAVNEWIRTKAPCDGVIDFEAAVWDPDDHTLIYPEYDSGDHLHPSFAGASHMAESIPLDIIK